MVRDVGIALEPNFLEVVYSQLLTDRDVAVKVQFDRTIVGSSHYQIAFTAFDVFHQFGELCIRDFEDQFPMDLGVGS
jgi:hypothetical protein